MVKKLKMNREIRDAYVRELEAKLEEKDQALKRQSKIIESL